MSASKIVITLNKEGLNMSKNIKLKPNKYLPVYVDGVGEVETKPNEIEVAYKGELVRFTYSKFLGDRNCFNTIDDVIDQEYVEPAFDAHVDKIITDKIVETLAPIDEGLVELIEHTVFHYYLGDDELIQEACECFDREIYALDGEIEVTQEYVDEVNRITAYNLINSDPCSFSRWFAFEMGEFPDI
ncbi:hypothetical protein N9N55_02115 [Opitutales bacterium]|nr:hypothetical protein [Opitutales bacterium]